MDSSCSFRYVVAMKSMTKKIDQLSALMRSGDWNAAIKFAAKFPRLDKHREPILSASSALLSPDFYRSMGRDVDAIVAAGVAALKDRYPRHF